jgi:hypothetical protein
MVPSLVLAVTASSEHLSCDSFSLGKTIGFGSLEFIADLFGGLSFSPMGEGLDAVVKSSAHGRPSSPQWAMTGDSAKGFPTAPDREGRIDLLSPMSLPKITISECEPLSSINLNF